MLVLLLACTSSVRPEVVGRVVDEASEPLPEVEVGVGDAWTTTDFAGAFTLDAVEAAVAMGVTAFAPGREMRTVRIYDADDFAAYTLAIQLPLLDSQRTVTCPLTGVVHLPEPAADTTVLWVAPSHDFVLDIPVADAGDEEVAFSMEVPEGAFLLSAIDVTGDVPGLAGRSDLLECSDGLPLSADLDVVVPTLGEVRALLPADERGGRILEVQERVGEDQWAIVGALLTGVTEDVTVAVAGTPGTVRVSHLWTDNAAMVRSWAEGPSDEPLELGPLLGPISLVEVGGAEVSFVAATDATAHVVLLDAISETSRERVWMGVLGAVTGSRASLSVPERVRERLEAEDHELRVVGLRTDDVEAPYLSFALDGARGQSVSEAIAWPE